VDAKPMPEAPKNISKPETTSRVVENKDFNIEKETKLTPDDNVPDWLKGSFDEPKKEVTKPIPEAPKESPTQEIKTEKVELTAQKEDSKQEDVNKSLSDDNVPDWLKGSFDTPKVEDIKKEEKLEVSKKPVDSKKESTKPELVSAPQELKKDLLDKKLPPTTQKPKVTTPDSSIKKPGAKKTEIVKKSTQDTKKKETPKADTTSSVDKKNELWDDGMKIPDWLKADDEK
jgi:hypothetical protein